MLTPLRTCYDVHFYDLQLAVDIKKRAVKGSNAIHFEVVSDFDSIQIDLSSRLKIEKITFEGQELKFRRTGDAVFVKFPVTQRKGNSTLLTVYYSGIPQISKSPPWDGGFVWKKDAEGRDWVGVACEGAGASLWWPCKDHLSDEPDSMQMTFTVPTSLQCIGNGNLRDTIHNEDGTTTWKWFVSYPINNYNVTLNIAHYSHFHEFFESANGKLDLDYYVLSGNLEKARQHFQQVKTMMGCFEKYFGPYPFPRDGFAMVETNYWGMEHQGAIAYGNNYDNNKQGFDYIIIHESAHEWWGNNVSCNDVADLWIHESFASYAEALYLECTQGVEASQKYMESHRWEILDKHPIIGPFNVNYEGASNDIDKYYKGAWMLLTFRNVLNNDSLFFRVIKNIQSHFALKNVTTAELISYINQLTGADYLPFFTQYLYYANPPVFQYRTRQKGKDTRLEYRWFTDLKQFAMPVEVTSKYEYKFGKVTKEFIRLNATAEWQTTTLPDLKAADFDINKDKFYIRKEEIR